MAKSFFDYYKVILEKVSFDQQLLKKEFRKAIKSVEKDEREQLIQWMKERGLQSRLIPVKVTNAKLM